MDTQEVLHRYGLLLGTFLVSVASAVFPVVNTEVFLLAVAAFAPPAALPGVLLVAAAGQVVAKVPFYVIGASLESASLGRYEAAIETYRARFEKGGRQVDALLFASSTLGVPPFLITPYLAGFFRVPFPRFAAFGFTGRLLRFAVVVLAPLAARAWTGSHR